MKKCVETGIYNMLHFVWHKKILCKMKNLGVFLWVKPTTSGNFLTVTALEHSFDTSCPKILELVLSSSYYTVLLNLLKVHPAFQSGTPGGPPVLPRPRNPTEAPDVLNIHYKTFISECSTYTFTITMYSFVVSKCFKSTMFTIWKFIVYFIVTAGQSKQTGKKRPSH